MSLGGKIFKILMRSNGDCGQGMVIFYGIEWKMEHQKMFEKSKKKLFVQ
jgi:hypothetical protein